MVNRLYNKQVSPKGLDKDKNKTESMKSAAATAKRMNLKKGSIPPQLKKFVMAKKKKAKMKNKKKVIG